MYAEMCLSFISVKNIEQQRRDRMSLELIEQDCGKKRTKAEGTRHLYNNVLSFLRS